MIILERMNISRQGLELAFCCSGLEVRPFRHRRRFQRRVVSDAVDERLRARVHVFMGPMGLSRHSLLGQTNGRLLVAEVFERVLDGFLTYQFLAARHGLGFLRERRGAGGLGQLATCGGLDRLGGVEAARSPSVASVGFQVTNPRLRRPCVGVRGSLLAKVGWQARKSSVLLHWHRIYHP